MTKQGALVDAAWERGAHWERLRIRRAQRKALRELRRWSKMLFLGFETRYALTHIADAIDATTRAPRGKGRKT